MISPSEEWQFDTARIGRRVLVFEEVDSTNSVAANCEPFLSRERGRPARSDAAETAALPANATDGLVVLAANQTAGRGRFSRVWRSRPGAALLLSIKLFPPPELRRPSILTAWAAVAIGDAIQTLTGIEAQIKWPNDLLIRGKKVCGILIEQGPATIVGIGLNLNQTREEFNADGLTAAASLGTVSGKSFELRPAAEVLLRHLDAEYGRLLAGERTAVEDKWSKRFGLRNQSVAIELSDGIRIEGKLREMSFDGIVIDGDESGIQVIVPERVEHIAIV